MKNYFRLPVDKQIQFLQPTVEMAEELFQLVDSNRTHFRQFLDFVDETKTVADEEAYLKMKLKGEIEGTDRLFLIEYEGVLVGSIDLHYINKVHKRAEIGYMLAEAYTKKGIMRRAVHKVCALAFDDMGLNKLTIIADSENQPSNQVAKSCGFTFVATDRQEMCLYDELRDMNRYALLKQDK